jgi:tetrahydromethanopterin S-methyltransferase subunit G
MWRRRFTERRGRSVGRRSGMSYGTAVLVVSGVILLLLYLTGRLSF